MTTPDTLRAALVIAIGLLLGSFLPADALARRRGIDIRSSGDGNPGTVNAIRTLGWAPGLLTAVYDLSVGVVAIQIAGLLGASAGAAYLAGIATIVGHRFPILRGFRGGGQGMAASAGVLLFGIAQALSHEWLSAVYVGALAAVLLLTFAATRSDVVAAVVMLPFLIVGLLGAPAPWQFSASMSAVAAYIWAVQLSPARRWLAARPSRTMRLRTRG